MNDDHLKKKKLFGEIYNFIKTIRFQFFPLSFMLVISTQALFLLAFFN